MTIFNIVLRNQAFILHTLLSQEVNSVGLLKQRISDILFIGKHLFNGCWWPFGFTGACKNPICFYSSSNLYQTFPFQIFSITLGDTIVCEIRNDDFSHLIGVTNYEKESIYY